MELSSYDKVTSVIDRWLAAVVKTDARLLVTVRLSSLVSCSTRWYLRRARPRESAAVDSTGTCVNDNTHCCCAAFSCCTASSYPWFTFFSRSLRWFSTDSISSAQPCSSRASSYVQKALVSTHEVGRDWTFAVAYSTWISQSKRSSSFRICSLSCFMSLDLSKVLEFTLKMSAHILNTQSGTVPPLIHPSIQF